MAIKVRDYEVRLTRTKEERRLVRQLRYKVFVEEDGAGATEEQKALREEYDSYDRFADYMGVFHGDKLVGTYRIIDRNAAEQMGSFYTETEYNISKIKKVRGNIAEMSRACVDQEYRSDALVMRMLWVGIAEYILKNKIKVLFGVASWIGTNPADSAMAISYLYYNYLTPLSLRATVLTENFTEGTNPKLSMMNIFPKHFIDESSAIKQMPPLIKGYLRLGATFGKGVFIDAPFNTYDVFVCMQTKHMSSGYQKHFLGSEHALDHLGVEDGIAKKIGNMALMPFKGLGMLAKFLLKDAADDAEWIDDKNGDDQ